MAMMLRTMAPAAPWNDRRGSFSPLKASVLLLLAAPVVYGGASLIFDRLGAEPLEALQHQAGSWALRFLFLSLAVTPCRLLWRWNGLIKVRRLIGLGALAYALAHLLLYVAIQDWLWLKVASEIATRVYLTIGFAALVAMAVLGTTSTDGAVRRLGAGRWQALHRLTYAVAIAATVHFFLQTRLDPTEAMVMTGLLVWLLGARLWRWSAGTLTPSAALVSGLLVTSATAFGEALFFHLRLGIDMTLILQTNLSTAAGLRPAWVVGGVLLGIGVVAQLRRRARAPARPFGPSPSPASMR